MSRNARKPMEIRFYKTKAGRGMGWEALRPPRTRVPGPVMAAGGDIPHDLVTYVVEDALDIEWGFWDCVAAGATFSSLGRTRTPQGGKLIAAHAEDLDAAEARVHEVYFGWRAGTPTPVDDALDAMLTRWRALPEHGEFTLQWPAHRPR